MSDSTATERQRKRSQRLSHQGLHRTSIVFHSGCRELLQDVKPYLLDPGLGRQLLTLIALAAPPAPINVAQVAQLSPLRYPGGKTWLVPEIKAWLRGLPRAPKNFVEPFAGGAIVGLSVAAEQLAEHVWLVEKDPAVAAVWRLLVAGTDAEAETLFALIADFPMDAANVARVLDAYPRTPAEAPFKTIVLNRVNRGGILAPGASRMKNGENGRGLRSRWYPETLVKRMRAIRLLRARLSFAEGDAFAAITRFRRDARAAWFIDPPYTASRSSAGKRLYTFSEVDHERLFAELAACAGPVLMTYDETDEVLALAHRHDFKVRRVPMKTTHHEVKNELLLTKA